MMLLRSLAAFAVLGCGSAAIAADTIDVILSTGDVLPTGETVIDVAPGVISQNGLIAFRATVSLLGSERFVIFLYDGVQLQEVARQGGPAPGGGVYNFLDFPLITEMGECVWRGSRQGISGSNISIGPPNTQQFLYERTLRPLPDLPVGVSAEPVDESLRTNPSGDTTFLVPLPQSNYGLWFADKSSSSKIAAPGDVLPDPFGSPFNLRRVKRPATNINASGEVLFLGESSDPVIVDGSPRDNRGIWKWSTGSLERVVRVGDTITAPGGSGFVFDLNPFSGYSFDPHIGLNNAGKLHFGATITIPGQGIFPCFYAGSPGAWQPLWFTGGDTSDARASSTFGDKIVLTHMASNGSIVMSTFIVVPPSRSLACFWAFYADGTRAGFGIEDDLAPDVGGLRFGNGDQIPQINRWDETLILTSLRFLGQIDTSKGLFVHTRQGGVRKVLAKDDVIDVNGSPKTVLFVIPVQAAISNLSGAEGGGMQTFNDRGQISYLASFTDGSLSLIKIDTVCPGDWDHSGSLDSSDFLTFLNDYASENPVADIASPYGMFTSDDFLAYLNLYAEGCD